MGSKFDEALRGRASSNGRTARAALLPISGTRRRGREWLYTRKNRKGGHDGMPEDEGGVGMYDELTRSDIRKMEEEIEHRKLVVRPKALEDVKEARAHGDLSENFEYYAAKKFKNQNESRIRYLERMIRTARVIPEESAEDEVGINNTVTVEFTEDGSVETFKIVTTVRGNSLENLISNESPLGKALLGKKEGDTAHVQVGDTAGYEVKVLKIENTVDDGSDKIRSF